MNWLLCATPPASVAPFVASHGLVEAAAPARPQLSSPRNGMGDLVEFVGNYGIDMRKCGIHVGIYGISWDFYGS